MALTHKIIETRPYLDGYLMLVNITNDVTKRVWHERFNTSTEPTTGVSNTLIVAAELRIQHELDYEANPMNDGSDEEEAVDNVCDIRRDMILQIRADSKVMLVQVEKNIDIKYPNSLVVFDRLYHFYLNLLNLSTWDEFKKFVAENKFRDID